MIDYFNNCNFVDTIYNIPKYFYSEYKGVKPIVRDELSSSCTYLSITRGNTYIVPYQTNPKYNDYIDLIKTETYCNVIVSFDNYLIDMTPKIMETDIKINKIIKSSNDNLNEAITDHYWYVYLYNPNNVFLVENATYHIVYTWINKKTRYIKSIKQINTEVRLGDINDSDCKNK